jgi:hypothetical protein
MLNRQVASLQEVFAFVREGVSTLSRFRELKLFLPPQVVYKPDEERSLKNATPSLVSPLVCCLEGEKKWPLTLATSIGTGKTCLALALCDHVPGSVYLTHEELISWLALSERGELFWTAVGRVEAKRIWPPEMWERLRVAPLVVIDEVGMREKNNDYAYKSLYGLVDMRQGPPLILCTNLTIEQLEFQFDARITDRLHAGTVHEWSGPSRR